MGTINFNAKMSRKTDGSPDFVNEAKAVKKQLRLLTIQLKLPAPKFNVDAGDLSPAYHETPADPPEPIDRTELYRGWLYWRDL